MKKLVGFSWMCKQILRLKLRLGFRLSFRLRLRLRLRHVLSVIMLNVVAPLNGFTQGPL
jgi:hypothetical protein